MKLKTFVVDYTKQNKLYSANIFAINESHALRIAGKLNLQNPKVKGILVSQEC